MGISCTLRSRLAGLGGREGLGPATALPRVRDGLSMNGSILVWAISCAVARPKSFTSFESRREAVMVSEALASLRLFVIADRRPSGVGVETVGISAPAAAAFCNTSSQFAAEPAVH